MQLEFFLKFPSMERESLRDLKKGIDLTFKDFSREYGDSIEGFFGPLLKFLVWFEKFLITTPWPLIIFLLSFLAWLSSRSLKLSIGTAISFFVIGYFGMWKDTMSTMAIISVATLICLILGTPIGVLMARSERLKNILSPVIDMMQTIPTFVYLIPIIMLLGIGKVPGLLAVCVYAIPPIVRLTNLGIREVDRRVVEAAKALGIKKRIILFKIEIPLALTFNYDWSKSNYNDGISYGCYCFNDWCKWFRSSNFKIYFKSIPCIGFNERISYSCTSNNI